MLLKGSQLVKNQFWRICKPDKIHNGYEWHEGVNIDTLPFNPEGSCQPGGLYFTTYKNLLYYVDDKYPLMDYWIARVHLDNNEPVYQESMHLTKWKAHQVTLGNMRQIKDLTEADRYSLIKTDEWGNSLQKYDESRREELWLKVLKAYPTYIQLIDDPTDLMGLTAVKDDGMILQYVKHQTEEICLTAVSNDGLSLQYVLDQTEKVCLAAIEEDFDALKFVKNQTRTICLYAMNINGCALQHVSVQTKAICLAAIQENLESFRYVKIHTEAFYVAAAKVCGMVLRYIKNPSHKVCMVAVTQDGMALAFVENQTEAICLAAIRQNRSAIGYVKEMTKAIMRVMNK